MKGLNLHDGDLHAGERIEVQNHNHNQKMKMKHTNGDDEETEIWLQRNHDEFLVDVTDASSLFYNDLPPLPDFPCMSSTSSSSSTPAPVKSMGSSSSSSSASSTSSAASWAVLKSDVDEEKKHSYYPQSYSCFDYKAGQHSQSDQMDVGEGDAIVHGKGEGGGAAALSSTASMEVPYQFTDDHLEIDGGDCMDVMETFGYMDLIDNNDFFFDPSTLFHETPPLEDFDNHQDKKIHICPPQPEIETLYDHQEIITGEDGRGGGGGGGGGGGEREGGGIMDNYSTQDDDLSMFFFDWLKNNKETLSAEDLRNIKLKRSTIESAAKRLGGGKEAMKPLLKLVLDWVQTNHLQKRRLKDNTNEFSNNYQQSYQNPNPNPNPNCTTFQPEFQPCYSQSQWIPNPVYTSDPCSGLVQPGYINEPFGNGPSYNTQPPLPDHVMLDSTQTWPAATPIKDQYNCMQQGQGFNGYGSTRYPYPGMVAHSTYVGDPKLARLGSSATKEARKKRMARQKRFLFHHRNHQPQNQSSCGGGDNNGNRSVSQDQGLDRSNNRVYCLGGESGSTPEPSVLDEHQQRQGSADRKQEWKPEKNLRFLLQKVLKQSDVGNLGRIVLPKKEAEIHLPELEARDGITIAMEDVGTSRIWNMRYRFWPNNKSRMYLLENTGEFVKTNGLQEGDFIVIYSDMRCGKYLIRGVKVRETESKSDNTKKGGAKSQKNFNLHSTSPSTSPNNMKNTSSTTTTK